MDINFSVCTFYYTCTMGWRHEKIVVYVRVLFFDTAVLEVAKANGLGWC